MIDPEAIKAGVIESFDFWLSQHDVSFPESVESAVEKAFETFLEEHSEEIIERIASKVAATIKTADTNDRQRR